MIDTIREMREGYIELQGFLKSANEKILELERENKELINANYICMSCKAVVEPILCGDCSKEYEF